MLRGVWCVENTRDTQKVLSNRMSQVFDFALEINKKVRKVKESYNLILESNEARFSNSPYTPISCYCFYVVAFHLDRWGWDRRS